MEKRCPIESSEEEVKKKKSLFGPENWTQSELYFIEELQNNNESAFDNFSSDDDTLYIEITKENNSQDIIDISKLADEWFIIEYRPYTNKNPYRTDIYYICDGWEEIVGFLESETTLVI